MSITELYSKRRKRELGNVPDTVTYAHFSVEFRSQLQYLIDDAIGNLTTYARGAASGRLYIQVVEILRREHGKRHSLTGTTFDPYSDLHAFVGQDLNIDRVLDAVQLVIQSIPPSASNRADVIDELNFRFKEHGLGYQFESGRIMRTDSKLIHEEIVRPALLVLSEPSFQNANEEFLAAYDHHRHGREQDANVWALKALESTLKIICAQRKWPDVGQAKDLLDTVFTNGLIEPLWQSEFGALRSVLESGVPTARNKRGGHGQGGQQITVPAHLSAFVLHQTAAAILFLVESHKAVR